MNPLVSLIVPVYNVEPYLDECIRSITGQTYSNIQIILIDDGSKDSSGSICDYYADNDDRIFVIHQCNKGVSAARNAGVDKATGEWILFVDSDDYIAPYAIEFLLKAAEDFSAEIVTGNAAFVTDKASHVFAGPYYDGLMFERIRWEQMLSRLLNNDAILTVWGILIHKSIVKDIRFVEGKLYEDIPYKVMMLQSKPEIVSINTDIYAYRQRNSSITHQDIRDTSADRIEVKEILVQNVQRFFPEYYGLAVSSLYADCMNWWIKAENADNIEAANKLKSEIRRCLGLHPLTWEIISDRHISWKRRLSLVCCKISFVKTCILKDGMVQLFNRVG